MKNLVSILMALSISVSMFAQNIKYNDVAVIVNLNSTASITIGDYFKDARNIPDQNMIEIQCSTDEVIDSTELVSIVTQVSDYLINNKMKDSINYIVTTKGIPITYSGPGCDLMHPYYCSAVDSELTLIINNAEDIGTTSMVVNPYYNKNQIFSQQEQQIYLVTRLDGYNIEDVKNLIDRSAAHTKVNKANTQFIFDIFQVTDTNAANLYNKVLKIGDEFVTSKGWNSYYSADPEILIINETDVLGYYSYNWQPSGKVLNFSWVKGSIAMPARGTSAFTFSTENNTYDELLLADHIQEGACGGSGSVVPYFFSEGTIYPDTLLDRYLPDMDTTGYNLAESFYMSILTLGETRLVVGDPKTSLVIDSTSSIGKQQYNAIDSKVYPNPFTTSTTIEYELKKPELVTISIFNHLGEQVEVIQEQQSAGKQQVIWHAESLPAGMYYFRLQSGEQIANGKLMLVR